MTASGGAYSRFRRSLDNGNLLAARAAWRCLFRLDWLEEWEEGAPLEVVELPDGGRRVRPVNGPSSAGYSG